MLSRTPLIVAYGARSPARSAAEGHAPKPRFRTLRPGAGLSTGERGRAPRPRHRFGRNLVLAAALVEAVMIAAFIWLTLRRR